jgi:hypothetical protein
VTRERNPHKRAQAAFAVGQCSPYQPVATVAAVGLPPSIPVRLNIRHGRQLRDSEGPYAREETTKSAVDVAIKSGGRATLGRTRCSLASGS